MISHITKLLHRLGCRSGLLTATVLFALPQLAHAQDDVAPTPEDNAHDFTPATPASRGVRAIVDHIEDDLDAWDVEGARRELTELEKEMAGATEVQGLELMQAKVLFFEGKYAEAVELYRKAGADPKPAGYARLAEDALAQTKDDLHQASAHFDLYYPPGKDAVLAPYALETLESAYAALTKDLDYVPPGRIRVEILPDDEALAKLSTLTIEQIRTTGTIAICKFNRLMIISPRALIHGYDWRDTLNHELVHFVVSMKSRNTVPIWLHEGLAKYEETRWRGEGGLAMTPSSEALLGRAVRKDKLVTFEQMHPSMALLPSAEDAATAFAEVFHAIEFLKAKGGTAAWNDAIAHLKAGERYPDAVAHAYKAPFEKFVADWKAYLAKRTYPTDAVAVDTDKPQFKGAAQKKDDAVDKTELSDFQDVRDETARKQAHLGGLLEARHHASAALEEYAKAYAKAQDSLQLTSRYGAALLHANQPEAARRVLETGEKKHPGYELVELHLGEALLGANDPAGARDHLLLGMNTDPFDPRLHQKLVEAYQRLNDDAHVKQAMDALALLTNPASPGKDAAGAAKAMQDGASVMLASHPFAAVTVDGKPLGRTTPTVLGLAPGTHHLVLKNDERNLSKEFDLEVKAGETRELRVEFGEDTPPSR